jgi:hypothetical protein
MTTRWVLPPILTPVNVRVVGGETIKNARLRIGEVLDAILFTYNGGAVFQRERPDATA